MATRFCLQTLSRRCSALLSNHLSHPPFEILPPPPPPMKALQRVLIDDLPNILEHSHCFHWPQIRHFSSANHSGKDEHRNEEDEEDEDEDEDDEEDYDDAEEDSSDEGVTGPVSSMKREYTEEEKKRESAAIGYKVLGPLDRSERVFKSYEPVFAVVQVGSHQFKVSNGDCIFTERLKFCEVNEKIILNKVLLLGSCNQTIVGRPIVPDGAVHAIVEEHALDAKVIIFKKKRRKNYRRTKGHRQELTKLRIIDIQGIDKPEKPAREKPSKIEEKQVAA